MRLFHFLFGTGWSMAWYALFYLLAAVPTAIFLGELRRPKKVRERAFALYALGMLSLTIFTLVHAMLLMFRWHVPLVLRWSAILTGLFVMATIGWTMIPHAMTKRTRLRLAWVHALAMFLIAANLGSLWVARRPTVVHNTAVIDLALPQLP